MSNFSTHNLLIPSPDTGGTGELVAITPESASWEYTSLTVRRLAAGGEWSVQTGPDEVAIVVLGGTIEVRCGDQTWALGERRHIFAGQPWALYLPRDSAFDLIATSDAEVALCGARAEESFPPRLIRPEDVAVEIRGAGNAARQINHIIPPAFPAHRLLVVEVFTPNGNWSSYPPHKHDVSKLPVEADLEEIYYYRIHPNDGFALQRLFDAEGRYDLTWTIHDGDTLLVPEGYHTFVVAHGYTGYYLNVLAGNETERTMQPSDANNLAWVRESWSDDQNEGASSWGEIARRVNRGAGERQM